MGRSRILVALLLGALILSAVTPGLASANGHLSNAGPVSGPGPIAAPNGPTVTVTGSADVNLTDPFPDANTLRLWTSKGNATFSSNGDSAVTVGFNDFNGSGMVNLTGLDVSSNALTVNPENGSAVTVSGDADSLNFSRSMAPDDGAADFVYAGSSGTTSVTANGLPATTQIAAVDIGSNTVLAVDTTDGSGQATFSSMPNSEHTVRLMTTKGAPIVENASATPQGGAGQSSTSVTLSVPVKDPDFPNDNVSVDFSLDGSPLTTEYIESNQTVSTTTTVTAGGTHNWTVTATDEYGQATNSQTFEFQIPDVLYIRNESAPYPLINGSNSSVEGRFFSGGLIFDKNTTTGKINMTGLPVDRTYIFRADANGYHARTIIIDSLFTQQSVYLLSENVSSVTNTFVLEDRSGDFSPSNTKLFIQKPINQSGSLEWVTIAGDTFGADGTFTVTLEEGQRYNMTIENANGQRVNLGAYRARLAGTVTLTVNENSQPEIDTFFPTVTFDPQVTRVTAGDAVDVGANIRANDKEFSSYTLTGTLINGSTETQLFSVSGSQADGETLSQTVNLTGHVGERLRLNATMTTTDGVTTTINQTYLIQEPYTEQYSPFAILSDLPNRLDGSNNNGFLALLSIFLIVLVITGVNLVIPLSTDSNAIFAVAMVGAVATFGWLPWYLFFAGAVTAVVIGGFRRGY